MLENVQDWMFFAAGALWLLVGAFVAVRALWADRARGRRRCPHCWYDMRGTPGRRCSECGREARCERDLFRTRRRRGVALGGATMCALGLAAYWTPEVRRDGWLSIVPTEVLLRFSPPAVELPPWGASNWDKDPVIVELSRRRAHESLSPRQWKYVLETKNVFSLAAPGRDGDLVQLAMHVPKWTRWCEITARPRNAAVFRSAEKLTAGHMIPESCGNAHAARLQAEHGHSLRLADAQSNLLVLDCDVRFARESPTTGSGALIYPAVDYDNPITVFTGIVRVPLPTPTVASP